MKLIVQEVADYSKLYPKVFLLSSAPCPPENVTETMNCDNGTMTITWSPVPGAITYTALLESLSTGLTNCCNTSGTVCIMNNLPCGEMYNLYVIAKGRTCNSSESDSFVTKTCKGRCFYFVSLSESNEVPYDTIDK